MLSDEGSYSLHSNANMTQLSNGQRKLSTQKRKRSCPPRNANRVCVNPRRCQVPLKRSVNILGKQNNYPTSIVSAQRQIKTMCECHLRKRHSIISHFAARLLQREKDFLCLHSAHPACARVYTQAQACTRTRKQVDKQASERDKIKKTNKKKEQYADTQKHNCTSDVQT